MFMKCGNKDCDNSEPITSYISNGFEVGKCRVCSWEGKEEFELFPINDINNDFTYVNITTPGCEGWLNLFIGAHCVVCVNDKTIADKIRMITEERRFMVYKGEK